MADTRRAETLRHYGLEDRPAFALEPIKSDIDHLWRIAVRYPGDPVLLMGIAHAAQFSEAVRTIVPALSKQFAECVENARLKAGLA